jgi:hypothetical protein
MPAQPQPRKFYTIDLGGSTIDVECSDVLPVEDDVYIFAKPYNVNFKGATVYNVGDLMLLMYRTDEAPYGRRSSLGNWAAITKAGGGVWANIEWLIYQETLVKAT